MTQRFESTLLEPVVDLKNLDNEGSSVQSLLDNIRDEIEVFYSKDTINDAVAELNRRQDDEERTLKVLRSISFENKPIDDLVETLKHREEMMRVQAIDKLYKKYIESKEGSNDRRELLEVMRNNAVAMARSLKTKKLESLRKSVELFIAVVSDRSDNFLLSLKQGGGLKYFAKLLSSYIIGDDIEFLEKFLIAVGQVVSIEANSEEFRKVHGVTRLIPFLYHNDSKIKVAVSEALLNLSMNEKNKVHIVKCGAIAQILENSKSTTKSDFTMKYNSIQLLSTLSRCEQSKSLFKRNDFKLILSLLSADKAYQNDGSVDYKNELAIQKFVLEILLEVSVNENNQYALGQENLIPLLMDFFKPLKQPDTHRWNFDILHRVLLIISRVIEHEINKNIMMSQQNVQIIAQVLQNPASYPEDVVMAAGSILTTIASKGTKNPYAALGLKLILTLFKQYPTQSYVHNLLAMMLDCVTKENRALVTQDIASILMTFIRESRVKDVLVHSLSSLASLCTDVEIVRGVVRNKLVLPLLGLLKLAQPELTRNIATILAAVAEHSENGLNEIANKGTAILVQLLSDDDQVTQEKSLITFVYLLSTPASGPANMQLFLRAEGERPLMDCILSTYEPVQLHALSLVEMLSGTTENREILRDTGIEECLAQLNRTVLPRGGAGILLRKITALFKQDSGGKDDKTDVKRLRVYWLKVIHHATIKIIPVRETLTYREFINMIKTEFNIDEWDRITTRHGTDEIDVTDQRSLNWVIYQLTKDKPIQVEVQPKNPDSTTPSKLDTLLQHLTHKQLRLLIKEAIDQEAELKDSISQYITDNRNIRQTAKEERLQCEPYGGNEEEPIIKDTTPSTPQASGGPVVTAGGPAPPPPPSGPLGGPLKSKLGGKVTTGDLMTDIKNALRAGGNLRRVNIIGEAERKAKGFLREADPTEKYILLGEEAEAGTNLWRYDPKSYIEQLKKILIMDYHMSRILFRIIEKSLITFSAALQMMDQKETVNHETLARIMIECGFYVEYTLYKNDETEESEPFREYSTILCSYDLPLHILLKLIESFIKRNGNYRRGEPLLESVCKLREQHRSMAKSQEEATQNYWTRQTDKEARSVSGEAADIGVVQGYWRQKEQRQVGKLWE